MRFERQEDIALESSETVKGALYHMEEEWVKTGGSVLHELTASVPIAAVERCKAKSESTNFSLQKDQERSSHWNSVQ